MRQEQGAYVQPKKPRRGVEVPCLVCNKPVYRTEAELIRRGQFCSMDCHNEHQRKGRIAKVCPTCNRVFSLPRSKAAQIHCSLTCELPTRLKRALDRTHNGRPARINGNGYIMLWEPDNPDAFHGWIPEHRLVMAAKLGRRLLPGEVVHHISGNKTDNSPDNLTLMRDKAHAALSAREHHAEVKTVRARLAAYEAKYGPIIDDAPDGSEAPR
jgi:hypothetical protein